MKMVLRFILSSMFIVKSVFALDAPAVMVPPGLNPGDTYYIMFVTSTTISGNQPSAAYPAHANAAADLSGVKGTDDANISWGAWYAHDDGTFSTSALFAADNTRPIYNLNGDLIANSYADLTDGTLTTAIGYDESGNAIHASVWTGVLCDGVTIFVGDDTLGGMDTAVDGCVYGSSSATGCNFSYQSIGGGLGCTDQMYLYAVSPLLTVPAPAPVPVSVPIGPLGLLTLLAGLLGTGLLGLYRRRYKN
jgi:hypothetical protein